MLLGQPELIRKVSSIPQLDQRIAIRYHLWNLNEEETRGYILHRLSIVATQKDRTIFTDEVIKLIFQASGGTPRLINNICDMCLLVGFGSVVESIEVKTVMEVVRDLEERYTAPKKG